MANEAIPELVETPAAEAAEPTSSEEISNKEMDSVLMDLDPEPDPDEIEEVEENSTEIAEPDGVEEPSEDSPESSPQHQAEEIENAYAVLRRDGWTAKDLEGFDDERLMTIAAHRKKTQGDVDRLLREAREGSGETATTEPEAGHTAEPSPGTPDSANLNLAVNEYAEYLGLDEAGRDLMVRSQAAALEPMQSLIEEQRSAIDNMQSRMLYMDLESARTSLVDKYPQIEDTESDRWGSVLDRMSALYTEGTDRDTVGVMEDAVLMEFREDLKGEAQAASKSLKTYRDNGQPDVRAGRAESTAPVSSDEREDAVLRMLESSAPDRIEKARAIGQQQI